MVANLSNEVTLREASTASRRPRLRRPASSATPRSMGVTLMARLTLRRASPSWPLDTHEGVCKMKRQPPPPQQCGRGCKGWAGTFIINKN